MTEPTLIDFLEARLDEREKSLRALADKRSIDLPTELDMLVNTQVGVLLTSKQWPFGMPPYEADAWRELLADVAAKRQLIELHQETEETSGRHGHWEGHGSNERWIRDEPDECPVCHYYPGKPDSWFLPEDVPCRTLRILALPHASHPDYRPEWAPDAS